MKEKLIHGLTLLGLTIGGSLVGTASTGEKPEVQTPQPTATASLPESCNIPSFVGLPANLFVEAVEKSGNENGAWTLVDKTGKELNFSEFAGKTVVAVQFALTSQGKIPEIVEKTIEAAGEEAVTVIGLDATPFDYPQQAELEKLGIRIYRFRQDPKVIAPCGFISPAEVTLIMVVNQGGEITGFRHGEMTKDQIKKLIAAN